MTATTTGVLGVAHPREAAESLWKVNMDLAGHRGIPAAAARHVRSFLDTLQASDLEAWAEVEPRHALLAHRAALAAAGALEARDRGRLRAALEGLVQALDMIAEAEPVSDARSGKELVRFLADVTEAPQARLAELLGVSLRQFQRWLSPSERSQPEGSDLRKVRAVARVVNQLRFSFTPAGAVEWFWWRLPGKRAAPIDLLDDPARLPELVSLAASSRSMTLT
ncbi:MAG TPA: hypothetical protein VGC78_02335 [Gaiellaceae bacterium]|jgi:hypothetical protein